jgi:hypothetical protein
MLDKLSMIGAVAAIIMIPHSAVRPSRGRFPRVDDSVVRRALPGAAHEAHQPKACDGCALKASDCKDHVAGPQRSGIRMDVSNRCSAGKNAFKGSYIPGIEMPCIWV